MRRRAALAFAAVGCTAIAHADTWYVRPKGKDSNAGTSGSAAFKTISKALSVAGPGDTIYIGGGTYKENLAISIDSTEAEPFRLIADTSGEWTGTKGKVTVQAQGSGASAATITGDHVHLVGMRFQKGDDTVVFDGVAGGRLENCRVYLGDDDGVQINSAEVTIVGGRIGHKRSNDAVEMTEGSAVTLIGATLAGCRGVGVRAIGGAGATALVMTRCSVLSNKGGGMALENATASVAASLFRSNRVAGVIAAGDDLDLDMYNCTLRSNGAAAFELRAGEAELANCILTGSGKGLVLAGGALNHHDNLYYGFGQSRYQGTSAGPGDLYGDPMFTSGRNDRPRAGSLAIDRGVDFEGAPESDLAGLPMPSGDARDRGCYERATSTALADVPYSTDFEAGADGCWAESATDELNDLTAFSGPFGRRQGVGHEQQTLRLATEPEGEYTLYFDLILFGAWEGAPAFNRNAADRLEIVVDGARVFSETLTTIDPAHGSLDFAPDVSGTDLGYGTHEDWVYRRMRVDFSAFSEVCAVTFRARTNELIDDESWAIDNVAVEPLGGALVETPRFRDIADLAGIAEATTSGEHAGSGWHWGDLDGDGWLDAFVTGTRSAVYIQREGGFEPAPGPAGARRQAALLDADNDGDLDIFTVADGDVNTEALYLNAGDGSFSNAGGAGLSSGAGCEGAAAADLDADGWCDVLSFGASGNFVGRNLGDTPPAFNEIEPLLGLAAPGSVGDGAFVSGADVNSDSRPDFFYHFGGGVLFMALSDTFPVRNPLAGIQVVTTNAAKTGSAFGDYDNDGDMDLFVPSRAPNHAGYLYRNGGAGTFSRVDSQAGISHAFAQMSCCWGDYDNDGDLDLFITGTSSAALYDNNGDGTFTFADQPTLAEVGDNGAQDCCFVDFDRDGMLDLSVSLDEAPPKLLRNVMPANGNYLRVRVAGAGRGGTNRAAVGVRVDLLSGDGATLLARRELGLPRGYGGSEPLEAHFGGVDPQSEYTVRVHFVSGPVDTHVTPADARVAYAGGSAVQTLLVTEPPVAARARILSWSEITSDETAMVREGVPLAQRGEAARRPGRRSLDRFLEMLELRGLSADDILRIGERLAGGLP